jgi:hypothetical protein
MDKSCLARLFPIQSARHAGESARPTAPNGKRSAKRSPEVPNARGKGPGRDGVAGDRKKTLVTGALRDERITRTSRGSNQAAGPTSRHRRHRTLVRFVGLRGRPWLELNLSRRNGPVRWLGRSWHVDEAGLQFASPQQAENDAIQTRNSVEEPWPIAHDLPPNVQRLDFPELISADQRCNHGIGNRSQRHPAKVVVLVCRAAR